MSKSSQGRKRNWKYCNQEDEGNSSTNSDSEREDTIKPSKGSRGKAIGLWYYRNKGRHAKNPQKYEQRKKLDQKPIMSKLSQGRKRNWKYCNREDEGNSSTNSDREREHNSNHPKGLRGRAIGLWYRDKARQTNRKKRNQKPVGSVLLSETKKTNITKLLNETASMYPSTSLVSNSYEHMKESDFKHEFLQHVTGGIIKKIQSTTYESCSYKNELLDEMLLKELEQKVSTPSYQKMQEFRQKLPSMSMKDELLDIINKNQVVVISGETGCGKTTQVTQFILDDYIAQGRGSECRIICTQPRRISAISVAERVAKERDEKLGISTGFQIRMEHTLPRDRGSILYCTSGVLLKFMEGDPALSKASHLILDEIHERDVTSDFLITVLKDVITYRSDIKVILMSATLNADAFSRYYDNAPHINIPGFTFPVTDYYMEDVLQKTKFKFEEKPWAKWYRSGDFKNYIEPHIRQLEAEKLYDKDVLQQLRRPGSDGLSYELIFALLKYICGQNRDNGSILVFVPGIGGIRGISEKIKEDSQFPESKYIIIPLHSQLPTVDQKQIFVPAPKGKRKIIIATNIAETSITIEDVTTVIDCGFIKMTKLNLITGIESLYTERVSWANASQRRGRAGRVKPGVCYHLFSKARYPLLDKFLKPEVLRKSLEDVVLQLKMLQLGDAEPFLARLMDPPESISVKASITLLQRLGALDEDEVLTLLGFHMAKLPIGARGAKMLIMGAIFSCLDPILSVAASLGFKNPFRLSLSDDQEANKKKFELSKGSNSDHVLMHYAIRGYENASSPSAFCREYYLNAPILLILKKMRKQFAQLLCEMNFIKSPDPRKPSSNYNSKNLSIVKAVIASGFYPNVVKVVKFINKGLRSTTKLRSTTDRRLKFVPESVLNFANVASPLVVYHVMMQYTGLGLCILEGTFIFPLPIIFFGDQFKRINKDQDDDCFVGVSINDSMRFLCTESTASIIEQLRTRFYQILESKLSNPEFVDWRQNTPEIKLLRVIKEMITSEDMDDLDLSDYDDM